MRAVVVFPVVQGPTAGEMLPVVERALQDRFGDGCNTNFDATLLDVQNERSGEPEKHRPCRCYRCTGRTPGA